MSAFMEEAGVRTDFKQQSNINVGNGITLRLDIDPIQQNVIARFCLTTNCDLDDGPIFHTFTNVPDTWFGADAAEIDFNVGTASMGGILTSHRHASTIQNFSFSQFIYELSSGGGSQNSDDDVDFNTWNFAVAAPPTSLEWGPDGRLYAATADGTIHAYTLDQTNYTILQDEVITPLQGRLVLGLAIDPASTPHDVALWLSHTNLSQVNGQANSGTITKLSGPGFATRQDVITGLPRSKAGHATHDIDFGPDGRLYVTVGGNAAAGAATDAAASTFGTRPEQPLSAAILVADVYAPTFDGRCASEIDPTGAQMDATGISARDVPCDVQVYASGMRNGFDFVFHSNGEMYSTDNGLGVLGAFPELQPSDLTWNPANGCEGMVTGNTINENNPGTRPDLLYRIEAGGYYGHPNPSRDECIFYGGNPTTGFDHPVTTSSAWSTTSYLETDKYQVGTQPDPNWRPALFSFGEHKSANGIIEYTSDVFCGDMQGDLLIAYYSQTDQIRRLALSPDGLTIIGDETLIRSTTDTGGITLNNPLPIVQDDDGRLYVGEFAASRITVFDPILSSCLQPTPTSAPTGTPPTSTPSPTPINTPTSAPTTMPTDTPTATHTPAPTSLLLHWPFDESSGTVATDISGNNYDGVVNGATWDTNGRINGALYFDGNGDFVEDSDAGNYLNGLGALSLSMWVQSEVVNTDSGFLHVNTPADGRDNRLSMRYDLAGASGGGSNVIKAGVNATDGFTQLESSSFVQTTAWQHIVLVWQSGQPLKLYLDGQADTPTYLGTIRNGNIADVVNLIVGKGTKDIGPNASWQGWIDDVRIYNGVLSESEILAIFNAAPNATPTPSPTPSNTPVPTNTPPPTSTPAPATLLLHWPFDESSGTVATDISGNNYDGVVNGAAWDTNGRINGALYFDGTGNFVEDSDAGNYLNGLGALSLSMWVQSEVVNTDSGFLHVNTPADGRDNRLSMRYDLAGASGGGSNVIKAGLNASDGFTQLESSSSIQTTAWQHIVLVWQSGQPLKLYLDGQLDTPTYLGPVRHGTSADVINLIVGKGTKDIGTNASWQGWIDDVRIYDGVLSDGEILTIFNTP